MSCVTLDQQTPPHNVELITQLGLLDATLSTHSCRDYSLAKQPKASRRLSGSIHGLKVSKRVVY